MCVYLKSLSFGVLTAYTRSARSQPSSPKLQNTYPPPLSHLLLGVQQINDLDIKCDVHRKQRRLPLQSYDPDADFSFDASLQCRLAEKDLVRWAACNPEPPVGTVQYSYLDVDINPDLTADERAALVQAGSDYASVFDAAMSRLHKTVQVAQAHTVQVS